MKIKESQPIESEHLRASSPFNNPEGKPNEPTEKYGCTIPRKNARPRNARKSWKHFEHLRASTVSGLYEQEALHKASRPHAHLGFRAYAMCACLLSLQIGSIN